MFGGIKKVVRIGIVNLSVVHVLQTFLLVFWYFLAGRSESGRFLDNKIAHEDWRLGIKSLGRTVLDFLYCGVRVVFFPALRFYPRRVFLIVGFSRRVCGPTPLNMFVWPPLKCCNVCGDVCVCGVWQRAQ